MGAFLDSPITDKNSEVGSNEICSWGACSMQGWRTDMEDAHVAKSITLPSGKTGLLFGVFDGHGGKDVAKYVEDNLQKYLTELDEFKKENYEEALTKSFMTLDEKVSHE